MSMVPTLLSVENLSKSYGGVHAVRSVSFELRAGEILALIGPNGAGKSTCFDMLNGQNTPDSGRINLLGEDTVGRKPRAIWRLGVGRTFQITATFPTMTVRENVQVALVSYGTAIVQSLGLDRELRARGGRPAARSRRHGRLCRASVRRARLWRPQAARARDRARQPAEIVADGRADRWHGAARADRTDAADRAHRPRAIDRRAVHRARHGRGVRTCRPHPRARTAAA